MKGDFSRSTFDARKHYSGVLMQQGRVQLDADWNELQAIFRHRLALETRDLIGEGGAPIHDAGFAIGVRDEDTRITIGAGRYYVGGIVCENEERAFWDAQPNLDVVQDVDHPGVIAHLYYLDAWERSVSAIEDPRLRDIALGGLDTTTRIQTIWQVRRLPITKRSFVGDASALRQRERELYARLDELESAVGERRAVDAILTDVREIVEIVAGSGHHRPTHLEAELEQRIAELSDEVQAVHDSPIDLEILERLALELIEAAKPSQAQAEQLRRKMRELERIVDEHIARHGIVRALRKLLTEVAQLSLHEFHAHEGKVRATLEDLEHAQEFRRRGFEMLDMLRDYEIELDDLPVDVHAGDEIEEFEAIRRRRPGTLAARTRGGADAGYHGSDNRLYRVEVHAATESGVATFKWSRENGAIAARVLEFADQNILIDPPAGDGLALFPVTSFVEISDTRADLAGIPGDIVQVLDNDGDYGRLTLGKTVTARPLDDRIVTVRRWEDTDGQALRPIEEGTWFTLEDGIEVTFARGWFRTGDYWLIPARTANGSIDWPSEGDADDVHGDDEKRPSRAHLEPMGIAHHYAPLAIVTPGPQGLAITDKRRMFVPLSHRAPDERERETRVEVEAPVPSGAGTIRVRTINWYNDDDLRIDLERDGFRIELDRAPDPQSVTARAVVVTAEPVDRNGRGGPADFTPTVLNGALEVEGSTIVWRSNAAVNARIVELRREWKVRHILLRVVLKGHAIWTQVDGKTLIYLGGRSYHSPETRSDGTTRINLQLPSEGSDRASDFESWSYL